MVNDIGVSLVILDEADADRILRILYNGSRPVHVHTLVCLCGAIADLRENPSAWDGWQLLPNAKCPACLALHQATLIEQLVPAQARERFLQGIMMIQKGR